MSDPRRTRRIGGSDLPKLMGISPYGGPLEVYERIVEGKETPWNPKMERGQAVEPWLRAHAQRVLGVEIEDRDSDYHDHPTLEFARAQIDDIGRWNGIPVAIDFKSQSQWVKGYGPDGSDRIPEHLRAQLAWELLCCDRPLGLLIVGFGVDAPPPELFVMSNVCTYQIQRDEEFEAYLVNLARSFWSEHVVPRVPPIPSGKRKKKAS